MFLKNLIRCFIIRAVNTSADFLKTMSQIERDKFQLAKTIKRSGILSANYSILEKSCSRPYYLYKFPYKIKFILKKTADFVERNKKAHNYFFSTIQKVFIMIISVTIYLAFVWVTNYWNYVDEFLVTKRIKVINNLLFSRI